MNLQGVDVTDEFLRGACVTLEIAKTVGAHEALFIEKSPSCGCGKIFDGTFTEKFVEGDGVTTALLKKNNIKVTCINASEK
jgi:uncharacterized protein YbbK (DUF523 family)